MARRKATKRLRVANGAGSISFNKATRRWQARYTARDPETGETLRKSLYAGTEPEARAKLVETLKARQDSTLLITKGRAQTVEQYAAQWLKARQGRIGPRTWHRYEEILRVHVAPRIGKVAIKALTPSQVDRLLSEVVQSGRSARTANYCRQTLRAMLGAAMRDGAVSRNVAQLASAMPQRDERVRVLTPEQARLLLVAAESDPDGVLWTVLLTTGLRFSELAGLTWNDVDLDNGDLHVHSTLQWVDGNDGVPAGFQRLPLKTQRSRRDLKLPALALEALQRQRRWYLQARIAAGSKWSDEFGQLVFSDNCGGPLRVTTITKRFRRRLEDLNLPLVPLHGLRHSAASLLAAAGVKLFDVSRTLGHSNISTTADLYSELFAEQRAEVAAAMDRALKRGG